MTTERTADRATRTETRPEPRQDGVRLRKRLRASALVVLTALGLACASAGVGPNANVPLPTVDSVDLERFSGLWYVISLMPTAVEVGAHNSTEHYRLREDGEIDITNRFTVDSFDGPEEVIRMRGWVHNEKTRAEWRVQPFWPVRLAYLVLELAPDYSYTVIGHPSKKYVWIMARTPELDPSIERRLRNRLAEVGYDTSKILVMPQQPLSERN